jgi:transcriptional regulator with XRE-family HTH domain
VNISKKIEELKDEESRQFFYEEHIETGLPIQLRELRKKRKLTQKELAELTGFDQSNISDWENPNYEYTPQIGTLKRFANAFDVPLIVRFGSWEELLEWDNNLSPDKVAPESFDEFAEKVGKEANEGSENVAKLSPSSNVRTSPHFASKAVNQSATKAFTLSSKVSPFPTISKVNGQSDNKEVEFSEHAENNAIKAYKTVSVK